MSGGKDPIRVLVVDDSPTMADAVSSLLTDDPRIEVVGRANTGSRAVTLARLLRPDVITMDLLMPDLDGPAAIMAEAPARILVVSAVADQRNLEVCFQAMSAGALELIGKPSVTSGEELRRWGRQLAESVCLMAEVPVISRRIRIASPPPPVTGARVDIFGLAASTGGPPALSDVLSRLPADLPVPIVIAQHITEGFTPGMVRWLSQVTSLKVVIGREGDRLEPGRVYFPLDGHDLTVEGNGVVRLTRTRGGPCPSGDLLLSSLARTYGSRAGGGVLTGMGEDGARGLLDIRKAGGVTFAQDEASSVVFGMPRVAIELKAADRGVPLSAIPDIIRMSCRRGPMPNRPPGTEGVV
ncbi:chemotaxis protein CheB [Vitiosangium sp. GDMCC 1.1324]|uniref:chemotaxis protein CheB n=1 Tax=Vitiosangium sp. (strain GDMCC 1.1324) TaxID=2138576 RepID=UPI000D34995C|nr:chemotaxis protein CheB [Vitiosangium sp. GDMCC 1.1324]PTL83974.1 chemotaxis response regulator protein-glutamate methylesterase [Vitiosangium sp. GDMCC 1.1324]